MKKLLIGVSVVVVLLVVVFGKEAVSFVMTGVGLIQEKTQAQIPCPFELKRVDELAGRLDSQMDGLIRRYSEEELRIEALAKVDREGRDQPVLRKLRDEIESLSAQVKETPAMVSTNSTKAAGSSRDPRLDQLNALFRQYKARQEAVTARKAAISTGKKALEQTADRLRLLRSEQQRLAAERMRVESRLALARSSGVMVEPFDVGDSAARIEKVLQNVDNRIEVACRTADNKKKIDPSWSTGSGDADTPGEAVVETVDRYFADQPAAETKGQEMP